MGENSKFVRTAAPRQQRIYFLDFTDGDPESLHGQLPTSNDAARIYLAARIEHCDGSNDKLERFAVVT